MKATRANNTITIEQTSSESAENTPQRKSNLKYSNFDLETS